MPNLVIPTQGAGCLFGARSVPGRPQVLPENNYTSTVVLRETQFGRDIPVVNMFRDWDISTYTMTTEAAVIANGGVPMLSWPSYATQPASICTGVNAGTYDTIIHNMAVAIAALGNSVILRLFWEMNGNTSVFGTTTAFIQTWQRIWTIMKGSQAQINALSPACTQTAVVQTDLKFCWCVQHRADSGDIRWVNWYPGNSYVDLIAQDAYNHNPNTQSMATLLTTGDYNSTGSNNNWYTTFTDPSYGGKPLMIAEYGCMEVGAAGQTNFTQPMTKAAWWTQTLADFQAYPAVRVAVMFDSYVSPNDYRIDTDPNTWLGAGKLSAAITAGSTSWTCTGSMSGYPSTGNFLVQIDSEIIKVTRVSSVFTVVTRGWAGTTAASHSSAATCKYNGQSLTAPTFLAVQSLANSSWFNPVGTTTNPNRTDGVELGFWAFNEPVTPLRFGPLMTPVTGPPPPPVFGDSYIIEQSAYRHFIENGLSSNHYDSDLGTKRWTDVGSGHWLVESNGRLPITAT